MGLALATSASAYFNAYRLASQLRQDAILEAPKTFMMPLLKILCACIVMGIVIVFMTPNPDAWSGWFWHQRLLELVQIIFPAIFCYALMCWILGFRRQHFIV